MTKIIPQIIRDILYKEFLNMQNGKCGICQISETEELLRIKNESARSYFNAFVLDHDHETDRLRGLLCYKCNNLMIRIDNRTYDSINNRKLKVLIPKAITYIDKTKNLDISIHITGV